MDYTKLWGHIFIFRNCRLGIPLPEVKSLKTCFTELPFPERHSPANFHASLKSIIFHLQVSHSFKIQLFNRAKLPYDLSFKRSQSARSLRALVPLAFVQHFVKFSRVHEFNFFVGKYLCVIVSQHGIVNYLFKSFTNHCTLSICKWYNFISKGFTIEVFSIFILWKESSNLVESK